VRGFSLAESENLSSLRRNSGGTERHARTLSYMRGKRGRMSVWSGTNPSPGPRRRMKTPSRDGCGVVSRPQTRENGKAATWQAQLLCSANLVVFRRQRGPTRWGLQMGILLIGIGCVCLALGVWGEHFYEGEGPGLRPSQRRRLSTGQGRIIFLVVGVAFIVIGIERLMYA